MMAEPLKFGFDLDNTLIDYGPAVIEFCKQMHLPDLTSIRALRQHLRDSQAGDDSWQEAQSYIYRDGLNFARPAAGSIEFLGFLENVGVKFSIISHKTMTTQARFGGLDLRAPALEWISNSALGKFFKPSSKIYFAQTRSEKIKEIKIQKPRWYVDDLIEVLTDSFFPLETTPYLIGVRESGKDSVIAVRDVHELKDVWNLKNE